MIEDDRSGGFSLQLKLMISLFLSISSGLYHTHRAETNIVVPQHVNQSALSNLSQLAKLECEFSKTCGHLLKSLYGNEFQVSHS